MAELVPVITCLKWGEKFPAVYVNVLYRALRERMSIPFRFVCITDHGAGLDQGIETSPLPSFRLPRENWTPGMWPKAAMFRPGVFAPGTPVLFLDLDVVVMRDLAPIFALLREKGGLHIVKDWHDTHERWFPKLFPHERGAQSSVLGFIAGEQDHLYDLVKDAGVEIIAEYKNDQIMIGREAKNRQYLPADWVLSFKKSLAFHFPVSLVRLPSHPPETCLIVAFHGKPTPEEVSGRAFRRWGSPEKFGFFPVPWVKRYWDRYSQAG